MIMFDKINKKKLKETENRIVACIEQCERTITNHEMDYFMTMDVLSSLQNRFNSRLAQVMGNQLNIIKSLQDQKENAGKSK